MNDRFKFRGVHPVLGELQEIRYIDFVHNTVDFGDGDIFKIKEVNMQQCTGLKDKNGKLIYEADIVKHGLHNCLVEWYKGGFWVNGFINGAKWEMHQYHNTLEVIGNVYENEDLLNA